MIPLKDDNPTSTFPYVTVAIIAVNALVFLYQLTLQFTLGIKGLAAFIYSAAAIPYEITHLVDLGTHALVPLPLTLFTAMFVHGGIVHIVGNMLFLWIFGDNIEDSMGHGRFIVFYLLSGLVASLTHVFASPDSTIPMVGASGAIAGILGAYFVLFPRARVKTLIFFFFFVQIIDVPAVFFLGLWFLYQILSSGMGGNIAWYAHIGGFLAGVLLVRVFVSKRRMRLFYRGR